LDIVGLLPDFVGLYFYRVSLLKFFSANFTSTHIIFASIELF